MSSSHLSTQLRLVRPPSELQQITYDAVVEYRRKQQIVIEREAINEIAAAHGHDMGSWKVKADQRTSTVQCWACGEGARLDLDTACARLTAGLTQRCAGLPQHTSVTGEVL